MDPKAVASTTVGNEADTALEFVALVDTDFVENGFVGAAVDIRENAAVEGFVASLLYSFFPIELTSGK